jgi:hypothetical protein
VSPNDIGDADTGPNALQNYPVIESAVVSGSTLLVSGSLNSAPGGFYLVEFFASTSADSSGFGEGERYLGSELVFADEVGNATFTFSPEAVVNVGEVITATATALPGEVRQAQVNNTSEFSAAVRAAAVRFTYVWDGGAGEDTSWFNPINWNLDEGVPGVNDTAVLNIASTISIDSPVPVGEFLQSAGTVTGTTAFTILDRFTWTGGLQSGTGETRLESGGIGELGGTLELARRTMSNAGAMEWTTAGTLSGNDFASFNNLAGGTLELRADGAVQNVGDFGIGLFFNNDGAIVKTGGSGSFTFGSYSFTSSGSVRSESGTLAFTRAVSAAGSFAAVNGASLTFSGTTGVNGNVTFTNVDVSGGTLVGAGAVAGDWRWNSGNIREARLTIAAGSTLMLTGAAEKALDNSVMENAGTIVFSGTGDLRFNSNSSLNNLSAGLIDLRTDASFVSGESGANLSLNNSGTLQKSGGVGTTTVATQFVNNPGAVVQAQSGTITFGDVLSAGGTFRAAGGAILLTGTATLSSTVNFVGVELAGGTLRGTGTVNGSWTWSSGAFGGGGSLETGGGTLTIPADGAVTLNGSGEKSLIGYRVTNNGAFIFGAQENCARGTVRSSTTAALAFSTSAMTPPSGMATPARISSSITPVLCKRAPAPVFRRSVQARSITLLPVTSFR